MSKKKILIFHVPLGAGHAMAAKALAEAFKLKYPGIEVKIVDAFTFLFKTLEKKIPKSYDYVTTNIPFLYKWAYEFYNGRIRSKILNSANNIILKKSRFFDFIKEYNPDFIIATNPLCLPIISKAKEKELTNIPSANVCTDFGFHSLWYDKNIDYYFVSTEEIKKALIEHGASSDSILITGVPVSSKIRETLNRGEVINKLGFDSNKPVLLVVGGRIKYGKLLKIIKGVIKKDSSIQIIIVAGRDEVLFEKLKKSGLEEENSLIKVFGFINNLDEYMSASDLILTKAGGLTMAECIVKELPMIVSDIIPGQEEDNVEYAVNNGFAIKEKRADKLAETVVNLFSDRNKLSLMKEACRKLAKPNAAKNIADFVVSKINII